MKTQENIIKEIREKSKEFAAWMGQFNTEEYRQNYPALVRFPARDLAAKWEFVDDDIENLYRALKHAMLDKITGK